MGAGRAESFRPLTGVCVCGGTVFCVSAAQDDGRYKAALSAAQLDADVAMLPFGDQTEIGAGRATP